MIAERICDLMQQGARWVLLSSASLRQLVRRAALIAILGCGAVLTACVPSPQSAQGFRLPDGDGERGLMSFEELRCNGCHTVEGLDIPYVGTGATRFALGGNTTRVKTYGELVTSIINPSHRLAPGYQFDRAASDRSSPMSQARLNDAMTVQQLVDLVAFLQAHYKVVPPDYDPYQLVYP